MLAFSLAAAPKMMLWKSPGSEKKEYMRWYMVMFLPRKDGTKLNFFPSRSTSTLYDFCGLHLALTAFFVGASAAWHLLRGRDNPAIRKMLSMAMWMALIVAPVQALIGDAHGLNTLEHQPAKIAAMEESSRERCLAATAPAAIAGGHWRLDLGNQKNRPDHIITYWSPRSQTYDSRQVER